MIKQIINAVAISLFPKRCGICGEVICFDEILCDDCKKLKYVEKPICKKCGCSKNDCICKANGRETEYKALIAPYYYENTVSKGILNMKMNDMPKLSKLQGNAISDAVNLHYGDIDFDLVTFIPMRKSDEIKRGFNQAELLSKVVSDNLNIPIQKILVKTRKTKVQKRQSAVERFSNMYDAFDIADGADVVGKKILLIDDVKTTGSTLTSASITLKANGAKAVYCAVVAIVKNKKPDD